MQNKYEMATQILNNVKLSSDNVDIADCYFLCANKQHIEDLKISDHQVVWGRRGTGKTTLLKAFTYDINFLQPDPTKTAIYIVMAKSIPTEEEIKLFSGDSSALAVYVFSKILNEILNELEKMYSKRNGAMEEWAEKQFLEAFFKLEDYLATYQAFIQGGELSIDNLKSNEVKTEVGREVNAGGNPKSGILSACINFFRKRSKSSSTKESFSVTGKVQFIIETQEVSELISKMIHAFGISLLYICLDEYSEMDKISEFSIQSKVAQLLKQVFFKTPLYSVKIATIWNKSKLHSRGGNRVEGIEYKQDIFEGPDLDIMFMENNTDILEYFKEVLVNTYLMGQELQDEEKSALSDYFETEIFGKAGLRHLICGSQGISRAFVILVKSYLQRFIKDHDGQVKLGRIYEIIRHQYLEDVRNKIPYYTLYRVVNSYVDKTLCRYFLIRREDYQRCKPLIKYLSSRGLFTQMPGQLTDRQLRDDYKLFVIHYGSYLDALDSASHKSGRKKLTEDAKLEQDGMLIPEYSSELINTPDLYTLCIPDDAEKEVYCCNCHELFVSTERGSRVVCPNCGKDILRFEEFIEEVAI